MPYIRPLKEASWGFNTDFLDIKLSVFDFCMALYTIVGCALLLCIFNEKAVDKRIQQSHQTLASVLQHTAPSSIEHRRAAAIDLAIPQHRMSRLPAIVHAVRSNNTITVAWVADQPSQYTFNLIDRLGNVITSRTVTDADHNENLQAAQLVIYFTAQIPDAPESQFIGFDHDSKTGIRHEIINK